MFGRSGRAVFIGAFGKFFGALPQEPALHEIIDEEPP